jgi:hypothetical protein
VWEMEKRKLKVGDEDVKWKQKNRKSKERQRS